MWPTLSYKTHPHLYFNTHADYFKSPLISTGFKFHDPPFWAIPCCKDPLMVQLKLSGRWSLIIFKHSETGCITHHKTIKFPPSCFTAGMRLLHWKAVLIILYQTCLSYQSFCHYSKCSGVFPFHWKTVTLTVCTLYSSSHSVLRVEEGEFIQELIVSI